MKHLYFIRHGESEMNVAKLWAGHLDTPLTDRGREQAKAAGKHIRDAGLAFDAIISSPLQRAHHTAKHVADHVDYPHEKIELHDSLKERNFGELDGKDIMLHFNIPLETYIADPYAIDHLTEVEQIEVLQARAQMLLDEITARPEETILLVSHGAFGRALQRAIHDIALHELIDPIPNAQLIKLI